MATTIRAYGLRGTLIAITITGIAAAMQGILTAATGIVVFEIATALVAALALIMAGATAARQSWITALAMAFTMALLFFWLRWTLWHGVVIDGWAAAAFASTPPWGWPARMDALVADGMLSGHLLWIMEWSTMLIAASIGCLMGFEPRD